MGGGGGAGGASCEEPVNLLANGSFEEGSAAAPEGWSFASFQPSALPERTDSEAVDGSWSARISCPEPNDAYWTQTVDVAPDALHFLSGWIKTQDVAHSSELVDAGANLAIMGTYTHAPGVFGTQGWTRTGVLFNPGSSAQVTIGARLGFHFGVTTGTAWFDDLRVTRLVPVNPHPSWRILVLIYDRTDFTTVDALGVTHRYVGQMPPQDLAYVTDEVTAFVEEDIPALTSSNMIPSLTIEHPDLPIASLSPIQMGWWPAPEDTAADLDPAYDAVIVIWESRVTDLATGQNLSINSAAGLSPPMGTGQTYFAVLADATRNVFKHEFGHSITEFFDAAGTAPKPRVELDIDAGQYVNCETGDDYVWLGDSPTDPIPNSIYNNDSGFTHDYYSGRTALATDPTTCLGITPFAWSLGGPVSHSGNIECVPAP